MQTAKANDTFTSSLRQTWIADPADSTIQVTKIPSNLPTIVVAGWNQSNQTKFYVTGVSGDSPANYSLTGVQVISGGLQNLPEGTPINYVIVEEYFNQYADVVNDDFIRLEDRTNDPDTPTSGKVIFYMKNGVPFSIDDSGTVTQLGFSSHEWITVADAPTMNFDLSEPVKKLKFLTAPLTGNRTFTLSNMTEGMVFMIRTRQDGTGNRQPVWFSTASEVVTITIANPAVVTTTFDLRTGTPIKFTTTGALPSGLTSGTTYYWIRTSATTGNLATSKANAYAGTTITTSGSQSGVHTMAVQIIWAENEVGQCSSSKWDYDDFIFTAINNITCTGIKVASEM
jgi:hypothetical protein